MKIPAFAARALLALALLAALAAACRAEDATTETWLCPICQVTQIERPVGSKTLICPHCGQTLQSEDLLLQVAYLSIRTRPAEAVWSNLVPECGIFRSEGLLATDHGKEFWVPWSAVEYYIPRQRILRLTSGTEFQTPYAMSDDQCPVPPLILVTVADSTGDFLHGMTLKVSPREERLSEVFLVARSPAARDEARARFIAEVEAGKHPRLPRTNPQALKLAAPNVPASALHDSVDVVLEVRVSELAGILKVDRLHGSGNPDVDQAALLAAYRSSIVLGGEMGVGVPSSMIVTYHFRHGTVTEEAVAAKPPMWLEWVEAPPK